MTSGKAAMTVDSWLARATQTLKASGIGTARLDALVLLEDCVHKDRAWLLAYPEHALTKPQITALDGNIQRRTQHEPLAYIRGKTEFYGREFVINQHVLEPRPETETMIDMLKELSDTPKTVIDVGTGSGALAITTAQELTEVSVIATDIDPECLKVARQNCVKHHATVNLLQGNLLEPVIHSALHGATLLCNLPYVPDNHALNRAAMNEPRVAIFGGPDGLDIYRHLFSQLDSLAHKPKYILTESLPPQHRQLTDIAKQHRYSVLHEEDFIQLFTF